MGRQGNDEMRNENWQDKRYVFHNRRRLSEFAWEDSLCVGKHEMWMRFCVAHTDDKPDMHILNGDENSSEDHFHARTINKRPSSSMSLSRFGCEKGISSKDEWN